MPSIWTTSTYFWSIFIALLATYIAYHAIYKKTVKIRDMVGEMTLMLVMATLLIGSLQLENTEKRDKAEFLLNLKGSFYNGNETNRRLIDTLDNGKLVISRQRLSKYRPMDTFTEFEVDEYITNFDYINIFIDKGVLEEKSAYDIFGWYERKAWGNKVIQDYIARIRKEDPTVYQNFELLNKRFKPYDKAPAAGR